MDLVAFVVGVLGLALAVVSIVLVFAVERTRAPQVVIEPGDRHWPTVSPFAHVAVRNERRSSWLGRHFRGVTLTNCRVSIEFLRGGVSVLGPIPGRWSGAPEPRDPAEFPNSYRWDLAATGQPEQVAIARTQGGVAHAFSAESYAHEAWQKPDWRLDAGEYEVVIQLAATEAEATASFGLVVGGRGQLSLGART